MADVMPVFVARSIGDIRNRAPSQLRPNLYLVPGDLLLSFIEPFDCLFRIFELKTGFVISFSKSFNCMLTINISTFKRIAYIYFRHFNIRQNITFTFL